MRKNYNNVVGSSQIGLVRKSNQDKYLVLECPQQDIYALMVLDGVGGSNAGDVASASVAQLFTSRFKQLPEIQSLDHLKEWTVTVMDEINQELYQLAHHQNVFQGMSTTCVLAMISPLGQFYVNMGDSRIYMLNPRHELVQLSVDHSLVNDLLLKGTITPAQAENHPMKHAVTNAVGIYPTLRCDLVEITMPYQLLLLCTDGLSGYVDHQVIEQILSEETSLTEKKNKLNEAVLKQGAYDNFTFILWED